MSDELELFNEQVQHSVELQRKRVSNKIVNEAERLVDELLYIIYNRELDDDGRPLVDAKVKLSAIGMLMDRALAKIGVEHSKSEVIEESGTRKKIRQEIEAMMKDQQK